MHPQREFEPLRAEPQPHTPGRAGLREMGKDLANGGADGFVRMEQTSPSALAPDKTDGQAAPQFAARRLVANAAIKARAQLQKSRCADAPSSANVGSNAK